MDVPNTIIQGEELKEKIRNFYLESKEMMAMDTCATKDLFAPISDKWSLLCMYNLGFNTVMRFGEIQKRIPGISARMLSLTLKKLQERQLVSKKIYAEIPPKVEYKLTSFGKEMTSRLVEFNHWLLVYSEKVRP